MSVEIYKPAQLICRASGYPLPQILWIHQSTGIVYIENSHDRQGLSPVLVKSSVNAQSHRTSYLTFNSTLPQQVGSYTCRASSPAGVDQRAVTLEFHTVEMLGPPAISKIQVLPISPTRASIHWLVPQTKAGSIRYYQVSYRTKEGGQTIKFNTTQVGTELSGLEPSTTYLVGVTAGTMLGLGEIGPEVEVTTLSNRNLEPANVTAIVRNSSIVQLDWEAPLAIPSMYIRGYNVYYKKEGENGKEGQLLVNESQNKKFLIDLSSDKTYYLRLATLTTWGYEACSPWIRIEKQRNDLSPPSKPLNVKAEAKLREIVLRWEPPLSSLDQDIPLDGYKVMFGPDDSGQDATKEILSSNQTSYKISDLNTLTRYIISIRAFNYFGGDSEPVYVRTTTLASPPSIVRQARAVAVSPTAIHVQWEPPLRGQVTSYHIRYWRPGRKDKESAWISGTLRNYVAGSLQKDSTYRFEIIPYSGTLPGESIVIFTNTPGDKPDGPPLEVSLTFVNASTLVAHWSPPHPDKANGQVIAYKLLLRIKGGGKVAHFQLWGQKTDYTFHDMKATENYIFRVAASTVNGTGVYSPWVAAKPVKPDPPEGLSFLAKQNSLTLQWKPPSSDGWPIYGYIVGYGQFLPEAYRHILDASKLSYTIDDLKPDTVYMVSVRTYNQIGESPPALRVTRTKQEPVLPPPLLAPVKLAVHSLSPTSLMLTWADPALTDGVGVTDARVYLVRFAPLSGEAYSYANTTDASLLLYDLNPATKYEVSVKVVRGNDSSSWSLPVLNSTQQIAPFSAPTNITVSPVPSYSNYVILRWEKPDHSNGQILDYNVYFTPDPEEDTKRWMFLSTNRQEMEIGDLIPHTPYYFKVQARNRAGYGPLSATVSYRPPTAFRAVPTNVTVSGLYGPMSTTVRVAWQVARQTGVGEVTGYIVYYTSEGKQSSDWLIQTERGLDTVIMDLDANATYYFKVQARYGPTVGPFSEMVQYLTEPPEPRSPSLTPSLITNGTAEDEGGSFITHSEDNADVERDMGKDDSKSAVEETEVEEGDNSMENATSHVSGNGGSVVDLATDDYGQNSTEAADDAEDMNVEGRDNSMESVYRDAMKIWKKTEYKTRVDGEPDGHGSDLRNIAGDGTHDRGMDINDGKITTDGRESNFKHKLDDGTGDREMDANGGQKTEEGVFEEDESEDDIVTVLRSHEDDDTGEGGQDGGETDAEDSAENEEAIISAKDVAESDYDDDDDDDDGDDDDDDDEFNDEYDKVMNYDKEADHGDYNDSGDDDNDEDDNDDIDYAYDDGDNEHDDGEEEDVNDNGDGFKDSDVYDDIGTVVEEMAKQAPNVMKDMVKNDDDQTIANTTGIDNSGTAIDNNEKKENINQPADGNDDNINEYADDYEAYDLDSLLRESEV